MLSFLYNDFMYIIPKEFSSYISLDCDRKKFIQSFLNKAGLDTAVISLGGKNHIYVKFPIYQYNPMFKIKTVIAHYDRFEGSPGANDNSAADFVLLQWAVSLFNKKSFHNVRLIFTDGEELGEGGIHEQGSFELAKLFQKLGITNDELFVFDCMGRGDVPIICENDFPKGISKTFLKKNQDLELIAEKIIKNASGGKWFKLHSGYSDNASFLVNNIPAVAITMLPSNEVSDALNGKTPYTWSLFHTKDDNLSSLNPESFELFYKILKNLENLKDIK